MTLFNKFISSLCIVFIMLMGVLAIHSIKVDTLPIDYALGLISKNRDPLFTIKGTFIATISPILVAEEAFFEKVGLMKNTDAFASEIYNGTN